MTMPKLPSANLPDWPRLMSPDLAAAYMGMSRATLCALGIPSKKVKSLRLYDRVDLDAWADQLNAEAVPMNADDYLNRLDRHANADQER